MTDDITDISVAQGRNPRGYRCYYLTSRWKDCYEMKLVANKGLLINH